jgi:hypothetical protein
MRYIAHSDKDYVKYNMEAHTDTLGEAKYFSVSGITIIVHMVSSLK